MIAQVFQQATVSLGAPGCYNLPVMESRIGQVKTFTSMWKPSEEDLKILNQGGFIQLDCYGAQIPVAVSVPGSCDESQLVVIPAEEDFELCKRIRHAVNGLYANRYFNYTAWVEDIKKTLKQ